MKINKYMKKNVVSIHSDRPVVDAINLFVANPIGMLPVIDDNTRLVGILTLRDILHLVMPDSLDLVGDLDFLHDLGATENISPTIEEIHQPVTNLMTAPISAEIDFTLFHAAALLTKYQIYDLPVIDHNGKLVGLLSHVDVGRGLISRWHSFNRAPSQV
jgi:IMP dehydrogenase